MGTPVYSREAAKGMELCCCGVQEIVVPSSWLLSVRLLLTVIATRWVASPLLSLVSTDETTRRGQHLQIARILVSPMNSAATAYL
jgi:hypothetical protein